MPFWKRRIENHLRLDDLLYGFERTPLEEDYALAVAGAKPEVEEQRKAKLAIRLKDNVQVVSDIILCLDDEPMVYIFDCEYAKDIIDKLDNIYLPKAPNAIMSLRSKLFFYRKTGNLNYFKSYLP